MSKINTSTFSDFTRNAQVMWRQGYERVERAARQLFDVEMNDKEVTDHSSLDYGTFARRKAQGDQYFQENPAQNYAITITKYRVGLERVITWEMRKYDKLLSPMSAMAW